MVVDSHITRMREHYDKLYSSDDTYWGDNPSPLSLLLFSHLTKEKEKKKNLRVLDLGCGQGPDALFFATKGFHVMAVDISKSGLAQLQKQAVQQHVENNISLIEQDMQNIDDLPKETFDIIFSRMSIQTIPEQKRSSYLRELQETYPDALHVHVIPIRGACFGTEFICQDDLLTCAYSSWNILHQETVWTIGRARNKKNEPYLMRESRIIAQKR